MGETRPDRTLYARGTLPVLSLVTTALVFSDGGHSRGTICETHSDAISGRAGGIKGAERRNCLGGIAELLEASEQHLFNWREWGPCAERCEPLIQVDGSVLAAHSLCEFCCGRDFNVRARARFDCWTANRMCCEQAKASFVCQQRCWLCERERKHKSRMMESVVG